MYGYLASDKGIADAEGVTSECIRQKMNNPNTKDLKEGMIIEALCRA